MSTEWQIAGGLSWTHTLPLIYMMYQRLQGEQGKGKPLWVSKALHHPHEVWWEYRLINLPYVYVWKQLILPRQIRSWWDNQYVINVIFKWHDKKNPHGAQRESAWKASLGWFFLCKAFCVMFGKCYYFSAGEAPLKSEDMMSHVTGGSYWCARKAAGWTHSNSSYLSSAFEWGSHQKHQCH